MILGITRAGFGLIICAIILAGFEFGRHYYNTLIIGWFCVAAVAATLLFLFLFYEVS